MKTTPKGQLKHRQAVLDTCNSTNSNALFEFDKHALHNCSVATLMKSSTIEKRAFLKKFLSPLLTAILYRSFLKTLGPTPLSRTRPGRQNGDGCRARWPAYAHVSVGCSRAIQLLPTGFLQSIDRHRGETQ